MLSWGRLKLELPNSQGAATGHLPRSMGTGPGLARNRPWTNCSTNSFLCWLASFARPWPIKNCVKTIPKYYLKGQTAMLKGLTVWHIAPGSACQGMGVRSPGSPSAPYRPCICFFFQIASSCCAELLCSQQFDRQRVCFSDLKSF